MKGLTDYIENELSGVEYDAVLLKFQRSILEEGLETEKRVRKAGLSDEKVMLDLVKSQHPDMKAEYEEFRKKELKRNAEKSRHKFILIGTPVYLLIMVLVYLAFSFITKGWDKSWLIIIGFVTLWVDSVGVTMTAEIATKRRLFHPAARVILALSVMMTTVFVFLTGLIIFRIPRFWVVFPAGVLAVFIADAVFAFATKQMLRIVNYLIYIVAGMTMIYIILGGLYVVSWERGWFLVILGVAADVAIVILKIIDNSRYIYRPGEDDD